MKNRGLSLRSLSVRNFASTVKGAPHPTGGDTLPGTHNYNKHNAIILGVQGVERPRCSLFPKPLCGHAVHTVWGNSNIFEVAREEV